MGSSLRQAASRIEVSRVKVDLPPDADASDDLSKRATKSRPVDESATSQRRRRPKAGLSLRLSRGASAAGLTPDEEASTREASLAGGYCDIYSYGMRTILFPYDHEERTAQGTHLLQAAEMLVLLVLQTGLELVVAFAYYDVSP